MCCYRVITHEKQSIPNLLLLLYCKPDKPGGEYSYIEKKINYLTIQGSTFGAFFILVMLNATITASSGIKEQLALLRRQIGHTPLIQFPNIFRKENVQIYAKQEWEQLSGSVKARAAYAIFRDAIEKKQLYPGKILLDATSGNTGIAYAQIGKIL
ncbi:MAG TPA: pyridoxal-phosphate dependent enzyme, partial [Puia sp.]|nr:pyridoxal-phosphate dependent enzyme [Puia sp.]